MMQLLSGLYTWALNMTLLGAIGLLAWSATGIIEVIVEGRHHDDY